MNDIAFLFCSDFFDKSQPDADYADEYNCVVKGGFSVYLFHLDSFVEDGHLKIATATSSTTLIYRGWMLTVENYAILYRRLAEKGFTLINTPQQYKRLHHLPQWYDLIEKHTAKSVWSDGVPNDSLSKQLLNNFCRKPLIVKDYVKSRKYEWAEACFIPDSSDTQKAIQVINTFVTRQGANLACGIVLREDLSLKMIGQHQKSEMPIAKEVHVFCYRKTPFVQIQYWSGEMSLELSEYKSLLDLCDCLDSNFYTVDLAQKDNGEWIIIEVGDGQVSGLQDYCTDKFYDGLFPLLKKV